MLDELDGLLEKAVSSQMVADVPVGILLSGGVDSSLITAMATRCSSRVQTFTIGFPGHKNIDETQSARLISEFLGTTHSELIADDVFSLDSLMELGQRMDEPIADSSIIPSFLIMKLVSSCCKVALGGEGGDELFGGYKNYSDVLWMHKKFGVMPLQFRKGIATAAGNLIPVGFKGRRWLQTLGLDLSNELPVIFNYFDLISRRRLMGNHADWPLVAESIFRDSLAESPDLLQKATRTDFSGHLPEDLLFKIDRSSMLNSLEIRCPMLDSSLVEFAFGRVPSNLKATKSNQKILIKRLAARILPSQLDVSRKLGLSIPLNKWLKIGGFKSLFNHVLLDSNCIFESKMVDGLLSGQEVGRSNSERLFALVMFELWRRDVGATL